MHLSDDALAEFERLWREDHPQGPLPQPQLREMAMRVLRTVDAVYHPVPPGRAEAFRSLLRNPPGNADPDLSTGGS